MQNEPTNIVNGLTSIIIVNYNTGNYLKKCIHSIYKYETPDSFQVIVIDNDSTDNTEEIIKPFIEQYNNIHFIKSCINSGFASANNTGIKISNGEYILILNPDTEFQSPVINELKIHLKKDKCGAISPLLKGTDGNVQYNYYQKYPVIRQFIYFHSVLSKFFINNIKLRNKYLYETEFHLSGDNTVKVTQLPCAFLLTKRDIFAEAGFMNEKYFLFFEDVDLSFRINKKYDLLVDTSRTLLHYGGSSFNIDKNPEIYGKYILSMNIFFDLNYSSVRAFLLKIITVFNSVFILLIEYITGISGDNDAFRIERHKYFLKLFKKHYF